MSGTPINGEPLRPRTQADRDNQRAYYHAHREELKTRFRERYQTRGHAEVLANPKPARQAAKRWDRTKRRGSNPGEPYLDIDIFERDDWVCWLCEEPVDSDLPPCTSKSQSIDHVIPLADGGIDDASNVRLAHFGCNVSRMRKDLTSRARTRTLQGDTELSGGAHA